VWIESIATRSNPQSCRFSKKYNYATNIGINLGPFALSAGEKMRSRNLSGLAHGVHAPLDRDDPPALQPPIQPAERRLHSSALELAHALQAFERAASSACQADTHRDSE
jgi:hypothetical protein